MDAGVRNQVQVAVALVNNEITEVVMILLKCNIICPDMSLPCLS